MKRMICILFWLTFAMTVLELPARSITESNTIAATGAFFALSVADMNATAKWYSEKLGMKIVMQQPKREKIAVTVLESDGLIVELVQNDNSLPLSKTIPG